jgi:hypothetical protein
MESLSSFSPPGSVLAVPPVVAAGAPAASRPAAGPAGPPPTAVGVEYSHRPDGVSVTSFIDMRTGVVIASTPAPQVLAVVDSIVAAIRRREV